MWSERFNGTVPHCEFCKRKTKKLALHHVYQRPEEYEILEEDRFKWLCLPCHEQIHAIFNRRCSPTSDLQKMKDSIKDYISV
jgi:hypothetical protein